MMATWATCTECNGSGFISCNKCEGTGMNLDTDGTCSWCYGDGGDDCAPCAGEGGWYEDGDSREDETYTS